MKKFYKENYDIWYYTKNTLMKNIVIFEFECPIYIINNIVEINLWNLHCSCDYYAIIDLLNNYLFLNLISYINLEIDNYCAYYIIEDFIKNINNKNKVAFTYL